MRHIVLLPLALLLTASACTEPGDCPPGPAASTPAKPSSDEPPTSTPPPAAPSSAPATPAEGKQSGDTGTASPLKSGDHVRSPSSLEEVNRWATEAAVREDLLLWLAQALPTQNTSTEIDIDYVGTEAPLTAVATATMDGFLDDSVRARRFVLKFSRKACETCSSGMSGWWLWHMDVTERCHKGRGPDTFSKERCN